jgi:hypothetical protein
MENECNEDILLKNIQKFLNSDDPLIQKLGRDITKKREREQIKKERLINTLKSKRNSLIGRNSTIKKNSLTKRLSNKLFRRSGSKSQIKGSNLDNINIEIENELNILSNAPDTDNVLNHSLISTRRETIFSFYENIHITSILAQVALNLLIDEGHLLNDKFSLLYRYKMTIFDFLLCIFDNVENSNTKERGRNRENVQNVRNVTNSTNSKTNTNADMSKCLKLKCNMTDKMLLPIATFLSKEKIDINYINKFIFLYVNYYIYFGLYYGENRNDQYIEFNVNSKLYKNACKYKNRIKSLERANGKEVNRDKIVLILIELILNFFVIKSRTKEDRLYDLCKFIPYNCKNEEIYTVYLNQWKEKEIDITNRDRFNNQYVSSLIKNEKSLLEDVTNYMNRLKIKNVSNINSGGGLIDYAKHGVNYAKYGVNKLATGVTSAITSIDMYINNGNFLIYILKKILIGKGPPNPLFTDIFIILSRQTNLQFIVDFTKYLLITQNTNIEGDSKILIFNLYYRYYKRENFFELLIKLNNFLDTNQNFNETKKTLTVIIGDIVKCFRAIDKEKKIFFAQTNTTKKSLNEKMTVRGSIDKITKKIENMQQKYDSFLTTIELVKDLSKM